MARHLHLYMNNPTASRIDGTEISDGNETLPLSMILDASQAETKAAKVAARCDSGYKVEGDTSIYFEGTNAGKWQVAPDDNYADAETALIYGSWSSTLSLSSVETVNSIFWVSASSSTTESPQNDRSVDLIAEGLVVAAE